MACRLHGLLCDLVAGGVSGEIGAGKVDRLLESIEVDGPVAAARAELAAELVADLRRLDEQLVDSKKRLTAVVAASKTTITDVFGVGPVVAAIVVGITGDIGRFANRDRFAAFNGTAPIEVSSGARTVYRLSRRGNRQLNHAIHIVAVCQIRHRNSPGRLLRPQTHRRQDHQRSPPGLETTHQRRPLQPHAQRRTGSHRHSRQGPGRATGERL